MPLPPPTAENQEVLSRVEAWFLEKIVKSHIERTKKLSKASQFDINPFTVRYLSQALTGSVTPTGVAKALLYPRVLGSSIATSFGQQMQSFISEVLVDAYGTIASGMDIVFVDRLDSRKKYAQIKLGPNTINKDDVITIKNHFNSVISLSRQNRAGIEHEDLVVGVMFGTDDQVSSHYKKLRDDHHFALHVGAEFWERLTGDPYFMARLESTLTQNVDAMNMHEVLMQAVDELAADPVIMRIAGGSGPD